MKLKQRLWLSVVRFAFRRAAFQAAFAPDGVPGIRDRRAKCTGYAPRKSQPADFECIGDGHHLCAECAHLVREDL